MPPLFAQQLFLSFFAGGFCCLFYLFFFADFHFRLLLANSLSFELLSVGIIIIIMGFFVFWFLGMLCERNFVEICLLKGNGSEDISVQVS